MIRRIPTTIDDFRERSRRRLPRFLYDYYAGGSGRERTLAANAADWDTVKLRQRVLVDVDAIDTATQMAGENCAMPLALAPIGLGGMAARRGEVQALAAAEQAGVPFTLSTVGICGLDELSQAAERPFWFQLYMIREREIVEKVIDSAWAAGCRTLVFTVDLPMPGPRHRDTRNGMAVPGARARLLKLGQVLSRPRWLWNVPLRGGPMCLGTMNPHVPAASDPDSFRRWIDTQFDPTVTWADIEWLREKWKGRLLLKGILDVDDAERAIAVGVDGIVVSNHGGRQLDGVSSTAVKLPEIAGSVGGRCEILVDGGIRGGIDVYRALALGASGVLVGRAWIWALAGGGRAGLDQTLAGIRDELRLAMALTGVKRIADIGPHCLDAGQRESSTLQDSPQRHREHRD
jgi:L-lactate dehydrogenase (cytochrome)